MAGASPFLQPGGGRTLLPCRQAEAVAPGPHRPRMADVPKVAGVERLPRLIVLLHASRGLVQVPDAGPRVGGPAEALRSRGARLLRLPDADRLVPVRRGQAAA